MNTDRSPMTTPRAAALGGKSSEGAPLLSSRPGVAPHGRGHRPGMRFLGLLLWQWGLVLLGVVLLYLLYIVGASFAWRKGGKRYHVVMITLGCLSGAWCLVNICIHTWCPTFMAQNVDEPALPREPKSAAAEQGAV